MVIFVRENSAFDPIEDDELIYVKRDEKKAKEVEMEMMTPILLDSMFEYSPPDIHRVIKHAKHIMDFPDDTTEATTESLSELYLPSLDTPPRSTNIEAFEEDDTSDLSLGSDDFRVRLSPRGTLYHGSLSNNYHLIIPEDVRFEGDVTFSITTSPQEINLKPRPSSRLNSIFKLRRNFGDKAFYRAHSLADSLSGDTFMSYNSYNQGFDDGHGVEECKDDCEENSKVSHEEGFAYDMALRPKENDYWGHYKGHYGSREFENKEIQADYAIDHESVQGKSPNASMVSPKNQVKSAPAEEPRSFLEDIQDMFATCFSCGV